MVKMVKVKKEEKEEDIKDFKSQVKWSVDTLLNVVKDYTKANSLLNDGDNIFLQLTLFKIPEVDEMVKRKITLKHSPYAGTPDVCFIARDCLRKDRIKRTPDEMIDYTIERFEDYFKKHKVTGITNILPYYQLKTEYDTYELRRKLVNRFDVFLCSSYLNSHGHFFNCLGKIFIRKNKFPIAVKLPSLKEDYNPKVNKRIQSAIASTVFRIKEGSDNYSIRIGNTLNKKEELQENLECVLNKILNSDVIPGGFENIRLMGIKTGKSSLVPLYISMNSGKNVRIPYVESNVPLPESAEGDVSTLMGQKVTVLPSGDIFVVPTENDSEMESSEDEGYDEKNNEEEDDEGEDGNVSDEAGKMTGVKEAKGKAGKKKGKRPREEDSDNGDVEEEIESFEQKYLSDWNDHLETSEDEEQEEAKPQKGKKRKRKAKGKMAKEVKEDTKSPNVEKGETPPVKKMKVEDNPPTRMTMRTRVQAEKVKAVGPEIAKKNKKNETTPAKKVKAVGTQRPKNAKTETMTNQVQNETPPTKRKTRNQVQAEKGKAVGTETAKKNKKNEAPPAKKAKTEVPIKQVKTIAAKKVKAVGMEMPKNAKKTETMANKVKSGKQTAKKTKDKKTPAAKSVGSGVVNKVTDKTPPAKKKKNEVQTKQVKVVSTKIAKNKKNEAFMANKVKKESTPAKKAKNEVPTKKVKKFDTKPTKIEVVQKKVEKKTKGKADPKQATGKKIHAGKGGNKKVMKTEVKAIEKKVGKRKGKNVKS